MFSVDVLNLRNERQKSNYQLISNELHYNSPLYSHLAKIVNKKALNRLLEELDYEYDDLLTECARDMSYSKTAAMVISKSACRQSKLDEAFIISGISEAMKSYGYQMRTCTTNEFRPCKTGEILSRSQVKKLKLNKDIDCLKSVDGIFTGSKNGYIFAKIVIGNGGHQDNVLHEINQYIDWAKEFGDPNKFYVMLIDGEEFSSLRKKQTENIWVVNHVEFQERLIES